MAIRLELPEDLVPAKSLNFGTVFLYSGLAYVRLRPAEFRGEKFNAVGIGHDGMAWLWDAPVQILDVTLKPI